MVKGKNLYSSIFILCCYGYQTGNCVILYSFASFCDIEMFIQNNFIFEFFEFLIMTRIKHSYKIILKDIHQGCTPFQNANFGIRHVKAGTAYPSGAYVFTFVFLQGLCCSIINFLCNALQIVVCPIDLFRLAILLSVLLRCTDSDFTFNIFKLFFIS